MYPRALENRLDEAHPSLTGSRRKFLKSALRLFAYIFGALFQQGSHIQNLKSIFVDLGFRSDPGFLLLAEMGYR